MFICVGELFDGRPGLFQLCISSCYKGPISQLKKNQLVNYVENCWYIPDKLLYSSNISTIHTVYTETTHPPLAANTCSHSLSPDNDWYIPDKLLYSSNISTINTIYTETTRPPLAANTCSHSLSPDNDWYIPDKLLYSSNISTINTVYTETTHPAIGCQYLLTLIKP